jgi:hypothetical protein
MRFFYGKVIDHFKGKNGIFYTKMPLKFCGWGRMSLFSQVVYTCIL